MAELLARFPCQLRIVVLVVRLLRRVHPCAHLRFRGWITRGGGGGAASDYTGIALLITVIDTLISGIITSVIGRSWSKVWTRPGMTNKWAKTFRRHLRCPAAADVDQGPPPT